MWNLYAYERNLFSVLKVKVLVGAFNREKALVEGPYRWLWFLREPSDNLRLRLYSKVMMVTDDDTAAAGRCWWLQFLWPGKRSYQQQQQQRWGRGREYWQYAAPLALACTSDWSPLHVSAVLSSVTSTARAEGATLHCISTVLHISPRSYITYTCDANGGHWQCPCHGHSPAPTAASAGCGLGPVTGNHHQQQPEPSG